MSKSRVDIQNVWLTEKLKYLEGLYKSTFLDDGMLKYITRPSLGKWKSSFKAAFDILASLVTGHLHSPGEASEGEDYPPHLKELISLFKQVTKKDPMETNNISAMNYIIQNKTIGSCALIGQETIAPIRDSV